MSGVSIKTAAARIGETEHTVRHWRDGDAAFGRFVNRAIAYFEIEQTEAIKGQRRRDWRTAKELLALSPLRVPTSAAPAGAAMPRRSASTSTCPAASPTSRPPST